MDTNTEKLLKDIRVLIRNPQYAIGSADIERIQDTLTYLKSYATMMTVGKAVTKAPDVQKDIEEARKRLEKERDSLLKQIEYTENEAIYMGDHPKMAAFDKKKEEVFEERRAKEVARREKVIAKLEEKRKVIEEQLTRLDALSTSLGNPEKVMEMLMQNETAQTKEMYQKLVSMCGVAMSHGFAEAPTIKGNPIFAKINNNSFLEEGPTKNFIQMIRDEATMGKIASVVKYKEMIIQNIDQLNDKNRQIRSSHKNVLAFSDHASKETRRSFNGAYSIC